MFIRKSTPADMGRIQEIYADARAFMAKSGNATQWGDVYPQENIIENDMAIGKSYVCVLNDVVAGVFFYAFEDEPDYSVIDGGKWLNDAPYGVIHRLAVAQGGKGVGSFCLNWAIEQCKNIRIDTHRDNQAMRNALIKLEYSECGIIYIFNGDERIAYQKSV